MLRHFGLEPIGWIKSIHDLLGSRLSTTSQYAPSQLASGTEFVQVTIPDLPVRNTFVVSLTGNADDTVIVQVSDSTPRD